DANADGKLDIADPIFTLLHLFAGGGAPLCEEAADADDSGRIELTDAVYLLAVLFTGGAVPPHPSLACGRDRTADGLACRAYPPCW
ncbi:MAG: hypothetical protein HY721_07435, partial [Planctomycetes bacterium]|nr:hypothetical protein [Planctomycetota bacterium]